MIRAPHAARHHHILLARRTSLLVATLLLAFALPAVPRLNALGPAAQGAEGASATLIGGGAWDTAHDGIYAHVIDAITVAPSAPETAYIDCYNCYNMMVSDDCCTSWSEVLYPSGCSASICGILVNSMNPNIVMALEAGG